MTRKSHLTTLLTIFSISTLLLVTLAGTVLAATNGSLETAQATIGFDGDTAVVTIDYTVVLPEEGNEMPIEVLVVEGTSIDEVTASDVSGKTQPVNLEDSGLGKFIGTIQLDAQGSDETSQVVVSYRVKGALTTDGSGGDVNIPIITTTWPPAQAVPGVFVSDMTLPAGYNYVDSFPSAPELIESQSDIVVRHNLQVLPAFVNVRLTSGNAPLLNFPRKIVFGTGVVIAIALIMGFSKYKKSN
jgi:hypothetical protein